MAGGYRQPRKPAPVSGPGRMSRRTDGGPGQPVRDMPNAQYGEAQEFRGLQQAAPLAKSQAAGTQAQRAARPAKLTPLGAPSARPDEPVTAGNPLGDGPGAEALGLAGDADKLDRFRPMLPVLIRQANLPQASPAFRSFVKYLKGTL